jgi:hypothetical protein
MSPVNDSGGLRPTTTAAKLLAVLALLSAVQVVWALTQRRLDWPQLILTLLLVGAYVYHQRVRSGRISRRQQLKIALVTAWVTVAGMTAFGVYAVVRAARSGDVESNEVVGLAVLVSGFAIFGVVMAGSWSRSIVARLREDDDPVAGPAS